MKKKYPNRGKMWKLRSKAVGAPTWSGKLTLPDGTIMDLVAWDNVDTMNVRISEIALPSAYTHAPEPKTLTSKDLTDDGDDDIPF